MKIENTLYEHVVYGKSIRPEVGIVSGYKVEFRVGEKEVPPARNQTLYLYYEDGSELNWVYEVSKISKMSKEDKPGWDIHTWYSMYIRALTIEEVNRLMFEGDEHGYDKLANWSERFGYGHEHGGRGQLEHQIIELMCRRLHGGDADKGIFGLKSRYSYTVAMLELYRLSTRVSKIEKAISTFMNSHELTQLDNEVGNGIKSILCLAGLGETR